MRIRSLIAASILTVLAAFGMLSLAFAQPTPAQRPGSPPSTSAPRPASPPATTSTQRPAGAPAGPATGAATTPATAQPSGAAEGYVLGAEDVIEVEVLGRTDFKVRSKIGADGNIQLPYIGTVPAANRNTRQLGEEVRQALSRGGFFANPIMRVEVVSYASRYVTVLGSVVNPGLVPVDRAYRLSEILARVGGVKDNAADYVVLRPEKGGEQRRRISELATGDPSQDPFVSPGDKIWAPEAEVFYISGQVKAPGAYPVATNMTLRMAVAKGGGLTELGTERGIKVTRADGRVEKPAMNARIMPGDVVVVGERFF
jgi:polysaccharide biosynthesis/export protein